MQWWIFDFSGCPWVRGMPPNVDLQCQLPSSYRWTTQLPTFFPHSALNAKNIVVQFNYTKNFVKLISWKKDRTQFSIKDCIFFKQIWSFLLLFNVLCTISMPPLTSPNATTTTITTITTTRQISSNVKTWGATSCHRRHFFVKSPILWVLRVGRT